MAAWPRLNSRGFLDSPCPELQHARPLLLRTTQHAYSFEDTGTCQKGY